MAITHEGFTYKYGLTKERYRDKQNKWNSSYQKQNTGQS